ncbi:hypothetical protein LCGC14_0458490 [marine sediment metagenome]|uniref:Uncharacterized protein n=1 Tax=marine sediment metagenome TaxID=412755 RepID=A0A0F9SKY1_9ZZZZ
MDVLTCDRYRCKNIMCDLLSYEYGYICHECFDELVELGIEADIKNFMNSKKKTQHKFNEKHIIDYFSEIFSDGN